MPTTKVPTSASSKQSKNSSKASKSSKRAFANSAARFVASNPNLISLTAAVLRAGLGEALATLGPITLFAPNDSAFRQVPLPLLELLLLDDEFIPHLQDLLLYHVLGGRFFSFDLSDGLIATALNEETLTVTLPPIAVNGNDVVDADNAVDNGMVHIIDAVLTPSWVFNALSDRVAIKSNLSILLSLVVQAGVDLSVPGGFTLLAPTNEAFGQLTPLQLAFLTSPEGADTLLRILTYYVLDGVFTSTELVPIQYPTLEGGFVTVSLYPVMFNDARVVEADVLANNGVLHAINKVLDPDFVPITALPWQNMMPSRSKGRGGRAGRGGERYEKKQKKGGKGMGMAKDKHAR